MKPAELRALIRKELDESSDLRVFLLRGYVQVMEADKVGGLTKAFVETLIKKAGLTDGRGKPASLSTFRTAWEKTKKQKLKEATERRDHKAAKSAWRDAFATPASMNALHPPSGSPGNYDVGTVGDRPSKTAGRQKPMIDVDAAVRQMFDEHRAGLPPMPSPIQH